MAMNAQRKVAGPGLVGLSLPSAALVPVMMPVILLAPVLVEVLRKVAGPGPVGLPLPSAALVPVTMPVILLAPVPVEALPEVAEPALAGLQALIIMPEMPVPVRLLPKASATPVDSRLILMRLSWNIERFFKSTEVIRLRLPRDA
jgi:hypothetical protein